ncbi:MAG: hypothetical protein CME65_00060 [Halobacteriovoraceae bacterium]|nr:hypothetical protein [Halobacteriovoraceae bacterium]
MISPQNIHFSPICPISSICVSITNYVNSLTPSFKCFYDAVNLVQHYAYSSFGKLIHIKDVGGVNITNSPLVATSYGFTNRENDVETGMMYYRARYYMPNIGRFIQEDPSPGNVVIPDTFNSKYIYVANNPTGMVDPYGKSFISDLAAIAIGVVVGIYLGPIVGGKIVGALGLTGTSATLVGGISGSLAGGYLGGIAGGNVSVAFGGDFSRGQSLGRLSGSITGSIYGGTAGTKQGVFNGIDNAIKTGNVPKVSTGLFNPNVSGLSGGGNTIYHGVQVPTNYGAGYQEPSLMEKSIYLLKKSHTMGDAEANELFDQYWLNIFEGQDNQFNYINGLNPNQV